MDDRDARQILADKEFEALAAEEVAAHKQSRFSNGTAKKSKHEKEKEAAAKKQLEEEEHAARAYEEFAAAFGVDAEEGPTQGGSRGRPGRTVGKGFVRAGGGEGYNPLKGREGEVVAPAAPTRPHGKGTYSRPGAVAAAMMDEVRSPLRLGFRSPANVRSYSLNQSSYGLLDLSARRSRATTSWNSSSGPTPFLLLRLSLVPW